MYGNNIKKSYQLYDFCAMCDRKRVGGVLHIEYLSIFN